MKNLFQNYEWQDIIITVEEDRLDLMDFQVVSFDLRTAYNNHSELDIVLNIKKNINLYRAMSSRPDQVIKIYFAKEGEEILFFTGVTDIITTEYIGNDGINFHLKALSKTQRIDRTHIFRSYQNPRITYKEIVESVKTSNPGLNLQYEDILFNKPINEPIVQYDETDWEFLIRICSQLKLGLAPLESGGILLGYMHNDVKVKECDLSRAKFSVGKNRYSENLYKLETVQNYTVGNVIKLEVEEGRVAEVPVVKGHLYYSEGDMVGSYELTSKSFNYPYTANDKIAGMVIEGSVSTVSGNGSIATMSVDITKGLKKVAEHLNTNEKNGYHERVSRGEYRGGWEYSYMTPYSQSNTGYFCTPEKGDGVGVYYPSNKEGMAYVMGAINSPGSARFSDPNVRNYTLPDNYDLRLDTNKVEQFAGELIKNTTNVAWLVESKDIAAIKAKESIVLTTNNHMSMNGMELEVRFKTGNSTYKTKSEIVDDYEGTIVNYIKDCENETVTVAGSRVVSYGTNDEQE